MKVQVPENLNEVPLYRYQNYLDIEEPSEVDILSTFLNISTGTVRNIKSKDISRLTKDILDLFKQAPAHTNIFRMNNKDWGFIPNLEEISYGENTDITQYLSDWTEMHKAMAVMYRPITYKKKTNGRTKYLIEKYKGSAKYSQEMKEAPLSVVMGAVFFFLDLTKSLLNYIPNYLEKEIQGNSIQLQTLQENGVDIQKCIALLKETLKDSMPSLNLNYTRV